MVMEIAAMIELGIIKIRVDSVGILPRFEE